MIDLAKDIFKDDNLELNDDKTVMVEPRAVPVKEQRGWRSIKHLGSFLGTAEDVQHRIGLAEGAFSNFPWKKIQLNVRITLFKDLVMPVLMYNAGLWSLTKGLEDKLDIWQRRKLRFIGEYYPYGDQKISNEDLYKEFKMRPVSYKCRRDRLRWLGHVIREGEGSASFEALRKAYSTRDISVRRRGGMVQTRWVGVVDKDLSKIKLDIVKAKALATDRTKWEKIVDRCLQSWETDSGTHVTSRGGI